MITSVKYVRMRRTSAVIYLCCLAIYLLAASCQGPADGDDKPYFDKDIPPSEDFNASYGTWNSDGTKIAFQHDVPMGENPDVSKLDQLWIYDTETDQRRKVIEGRVLNIDWSPDGEWFVFHSFSDPEFLFKVRSDGTDLTRLTGNGSPNDLEYTSVGRWSPNGGTILFTVIAGEPRGVSVMNPDGTEPIILIPYGVGANWLPSGEKFVYANWDTTVQDTDRQRQLYVANKDGNEIKKITDLPNSTYISAPVVSPDGTQIAFTYTGNNGRDEIFLMDINGTNIKQMTSGKGLIRRPEWNPNGTEILFTRFIPNVSERMYLLDVKTREVEPVFPAE